MDVRVTQGYRASFAEPLSVVGARAGIAYQLSATDAPSDGCSCTVTEHTDDGGTTGLDGSGLPSTSECQVDEPGERGSSAVSCGCRQQPRVQHGGAAGGSGRGLASADTLRVDLRTGEVQQGVCVVEVDGEDVQGGCEPGSCRRVRDSPRRESPRKDSSYKQGVDAHAEGDAQAPLTDQQHEQRRSRHRPELPHVQQQQQQQERSQLEQQERQVQPLQRQQHQPGHQNGPLGKLSPLHAAVVAAPAGFTALSSGRPPRAPRCEWELDPRRVLVGRRLAVGGFAEVFIGKYEVRCTA